MRQSWNDKYNPNGTNNKWLRRCESRASHSPLKAFKQDNPLIYVRTFIREIINGMAERGQTEIVSTHGCDFNSQSLCRHKSNLTNQNYVNNTIIRAYAIYVQFTERTIHGIAYSFPYTQVCLPYCMVPCKQTIN